MKPTCNYRINYDDEDPFLCKRNTYQNDLCILHFTNPDKNKESFDNLIKYELEDSTSDMLDFRGVEFRHVPEAFKSAIFQKNIRFDRAVFFCPLEFHGVTFQKSCKFASTQFRGSVVFEGCTFVGDFQFEEIPDNKVAIAFKDFGFQSAASFSQFSTSSTFSLENGTFAEGTDFEHVTFRSSFQLIDVEFNGKTNFHYCTFQVPIILKGVTFANDTHFLVSGMNGEQKFNDVKFHGATRFDKAQVLPHKFNFTECDFRELRILDLPLLEGRITHEDCTWPKKYWNKFGRSIIADEIDAKIRKQSLQGDMKLSLLVLKGYEYLHRKYYENSEYDQAREFYVSSMVQKRKLEKFFSSARLTSFIYSVLSRYGESMIRPFLAMMAIWLLFPVLLLQEGYVLEVTNVLRESETILIEKPFFEELPDGSFELIFVTDEYWDTFKLSFSLSTFLRSGAPRPLLTSNANMILILETLLTGLFFGLLIMGIRRRFAPKKPIR